MEKSLQPLENNTTRTEKYVKLGAAFISTLSPIGSVISTVINESISSAQQSRMIDFVNELLKLYQEQNREIEEIKKAFETMVSTAGNTLLFELAMKASANTNSNMLHHCYAYIIFNSIENKSLEDSRNEKLLRTLSELTEEEIIHLINFSQSKGMFTSSEFDKKYEEIIMPKSRSDRLLENEIHNAFRNEYILTLEQKGLVTILKRLDGNYPINFNDVRITDYGYLIIKAIYDENFFGKINK